MKCHIRLLTMVVVGLSGVTASNAADYGGGPWPPGYGSENDYGSRPYGSGYDRNPAPWGGAPYDTPSYGRPSYPPPPPNPWDRRSGPGYGMGYGGEPAYNGGPNDYGYGTDPSQRYPAYGTTRGGWTNYPGSGERTPDYYWGDRAPDFGTDSGHRGYSGAEGRQSYGGYGSPPDRVMGRQDYAYPRDNSNGGSDYGRRLPPPPAPLPRSRYDFPEPNAPASSSSPWERQGDADASPPSVQGGSSYESNQQPPAEENATNRESEQQPSNATGTSNTGDYPSSWGFSVESGNGLIPSPSDGTPASPAAQESGKLNGELEQK